MTEASLKRALEVMTTLNENVVTIARVREMAQTALDIHNQPERKDHAPNESTT